MAIIGILAAVALPVARFGLRRQKEIELRDRLRKITDAIDRYHELMTMGALAAAGQPLQVRPAQMQALGSDGYPKDLEELLKGVKMSDGKTIRLHPRARPDRSDDRPQRVDHAVDDRRSRSTFTTLHVGESCGERLRGALDLDGARRSTARRITTNGDER